MMNKLKKKKRIITDLQLTPDQIRMLILKIKLNLLICLQNILSIFVVVTVVHRHQQIQKECSVQKIVN